MAFLSDPVGFDLRVAFAQAARRHPFEAVDQFRQLHGRGIFHKQMHMVGFAVELGQGGSLDCAYITHDLFHVTQHGAAQHLAAILGDEDQMGVKHEHAMATGTKRFIGHRPIEYIARICEYFTHESHKDQYADQDLAGARERQARSTVVAYGL